MLLPLLLLTTLPHSHSHPQKVLATNLHTLTLHANKQTTSRRHPPIPQLTCIGGNAHSLHQISSMQCRSQGPSYTPTDIQWTCTAETGSYFKLGSTQVLCEGYDYPDDPYILAGSCGVEYRLMLTEAGEAKFGSSFGSSFARETTDRAWWVGVVFWMLFLGVAGVILRGIFVQWRRGREGGGRVLGSGGGRGGGDDDDGDDPPPPYDEYGDSCLAGESVQAGSRFGPANVAMAAAAGAAAGVAATQAYRSSRRQAESSPASPQPRTTRTWDSDSGGRQESMGFGGTTRR